MRANIFRFLVIVTALCLTLTSHTPIQGSGSEEGTGSGSAGVDADAFIKEGRRIMGAHWYTSHKAYASAYARSYIHTSDGYIQNSGSYSIGAELQPSYNRDSDGGYYTGKLVDSVEAYDLFRGDPADVDGWGAADSTVYGIRGLYDQANQSGSL